MMEEILKEGNVSDAYVIEEVDSIDLPEAELAQFQEAQPLEVMGFINDENLIEEEPELIKKFVRGEGEFPELYTKLEPDDEDDNEDEEDNEEAEESDKDEQRVPIDNIYDDYDSEQPCTSAEAARQIKREKYATRNEATDEAERLASDRPRLTRKRTVLSGALQGLMGEANLSYARGKIEMAEKLCLEIIRQNPLASEPFLTLAEIYETRDKEKHLNFLTIAAHLNPHDRDQWIRIAEMHIAKGNLARARIYYSKAIKALPKDYDLRLRKARLLEEMKDQTSAMTTYLRMVPLVPEEESELCLEIAKKVAAYYHQCKKPQLALQAMEGAHNVCSQLFSMEDLNLYLELLILNKEYRKVVHCLYQRTNFELKIEFDSQEERIVYVRIPDDYLPDFRAKLCVSLIKLRPCHLLFYLVQNVHEFIPPVEEHLNLYVDIAEALMQEHKYAEAIELLRPVTNCEQLESCPAFIWLRQAECLRQLNKYNDAIDSYQEVVANAPYCYEAKFTLAALLKQQGRYAEAVIALEQTEESEGQPLHARLLYERCMMFKQVGDIDGYLEAGCNFLARRSLKLRTREEISTIACGVSLYHLDGLKTILQMRNIGKSDIPPDSYEFNIKAQTDITDMSIEDEYQLFLELIRIGYEHRKYSILERICFAMITTKRFIDFHHELEYIIILTCYFNDDCSVAFSYLREPLSKNPSNNSLWNLLNLFFQKAQDVRYCRFIRRIIQRCPNLQHLRLFLAHYSLNCSSYKLALNVYSQLFKENPTSLLALCIAVAFNQVSMQKRVLSRTAAVGQAVAFIEKYGNMRRLECSEKGNEVTSREKSAQETSCIAEQEICYNIGRIYHQAGILHLALEYYERALRIQHPSIKAHEQFLGLQHEIAYNIHLIYRASGNLRKARQYLYEYCVV